MSKPVKTIRLGGVQASIWQDDEGRVSASYNKSYKTKEGEWKNTTYFNAEDTALLIAVAHKAISIIGQLKEKKSEAVSNVVQSPTLPLTDDDIPF